MKPSTKKPDPAINYIRIEKGTPQDGFEEVFVINNHKSKKISCVIFYIQPGNPKSKTHIKVPHLKPKEKRSVGKFSVDFGYQYVVESASYDS